VSPQEWESPLWLRERQKSWGLVEWVVHDARRWRVHHLLIETQAAGHSLEQELRRLHGNNDWTVQLIKATKDKRARAFAVVPLFANGIVHVPEYSDGSHPTWAEHVLDQFTSFPRTKYKDLVDSGTHALQYLRDTGLLMRREEYDEEIRHGLRYKPKVKPLYDV
jgi:predicted phage terminase large subunit-like protein